MKSPTLGDTGNAFLSPRELLPVLLEESSAPHEQLAVGWGTPPIMSPATSSPLGWSPSPTYVPDYPDLVELPPAGTTDDRVMSKPIEPHSQQRFPGTLESSVGRSSLDLHDNIARDHPLYHNVTPHADGLYHCPWENKPEAYCQHKPEKLKSNYEYDQISFSPLLPPFSTSACLTLIMSFLLVNLWILTFLQHPAVLLIPS
jgi:hypothetical protein